MKLACITPNIKRDYLVEMTLEGLQQRGHQLACSGTGNGVIETDRASWTWFASHADAIIIFFGKVNGNEPPRRSWAHGIKKPVIYVDGSEWTCTAHKNPGQLERAVVNSVRYREEPWLDADMLELSSAYLKRECYVDDVINHGVIPFPFALQKRHLMSYDENAKDIDVLCAFGQDQTGLRKPVTEALQELSKKRQDLQIVACKLNDQQYLDALLRSRYVLDAWGGGNTCDRFFEIVGAGAVPISQTPSVIIPDSYVHNEHLLFFDTTSDVVELINSLPVEEKRREMSNSCIKHTAQFHSARARAIQIEKIIKEFNKC